MKKLKNKLKPVRQARGHLYDPNAPNDLMQPPEDWQFAKPIASGEIRGRGLEKPSRPKLNIEAILPHKHYREEIVMAKKMTRDEKILKVAELYNEGRTWAEITEFLGYKGPGSVHPFFVEARGRGLIKRMRDGRAVNKDVEDNALSQITVDDFAAQVQKKLTEAERLKQAATIAQALTELLGDAAADLLGQLYERVNA